MRSPTPSKGPRVISPHQPKARRPAKVSDPIRHRWVPCPDLRSRGSHPHSSASVAGDSGVPVTKIELLPSYSTATLIEEPAQVEDPWDLPELQDTGVKWSGKQAAEAGSRGAAGSGSPPSSPSPLHCSDALRTRVLRVGGVAQHSPSRCEAPGFPSQSWKIRQRKLKSWLGKPPPLLGLMSQHDR